MSASGDVRTGVRQFVLEKFLVGEPPDSLKDSTPLMSSGILSSIATLELVAFLETQYSVMLQPADLTRERLDSVDRIVALVDELRQRQRETR